MQRQRLFQAAMVRARSRTCAAATLSNIESAGRRPLMALRETAHDDASDKLNGEARRWSCLKRSGLSGPLVC